MNILRQKRVGRASRLITFGIIMSFTGTMVVNPLPCHAQPALYQSGTGATAAVLNLPAPGTMVGPSPSFVPPSLRGLKIHPENPFRFDFILDNGDTDIDGEELEQESRKLIKYFLASLTIPEDDQWVNLSPYEGDRIIPDEFGVTEMGRDLLAQDYLLKQLTASLIYPEKELGREFWDRVYQKAEALYGTSEIPMNTFNKVWIVPAEAVVYEKGDTVFITKSRLKVMLEEDYVALSHNTRLQDTGHRTQESGGLEENSGIQENNATPLTSRVQRGEAGVSTSQGNAQDNQLQTTLLKELVLPEIEKEVNEGKGFALLRQIYHSMILATWYKQALKPGLLAQIYADQKKVMGVDIEDRDARQEIYRQYVEAYKKGVFNYIRRDYDPKTESPVPRKYFSGGFKNEIPNTLERLNALPAEIDRVSKTDLIQVELDPVLDPRAVLEDIKARERDGPITVQDVQTLHAMFVNDQLRGDEAFYHGFMRRQQVAANDADVRGLAGYYVQQASPSPQPGGEGPVGIVAMAEDEGTSDGVTGDRGDMAMTVQNHPPDKTTGLSGTTMLVKSMVGDFIRSSREERGMTQLQLAERLDVHSSTVANWEKGIHVPQKQNRLALSQILQIENEDLERRIKNTSILNLEGWTSLYEIESRDQFDEKGAFVREYSALKYGSAEAIELFSEKLKDAIEMKYGDSIRENRGEWIIVTTSYDLVISNIMPLCESVAHKLGIEFIRAKRDHRPKETPAKTYPALKTREERLAFHTAYDVDLETTKPLQGKKVIIIDDAVASGAAVQDQIRIISRKYPVEIVDVFVVVAATTADDLSVENSMNDYLLNAQDISPLISILSQSNTLPNRHSLITIFNVDERKFQAIIESLPYEALTKFLTAAEGYFEKSEKTDRMTRLRNQVQLRNLQRQVDKLPGRSIILLGGPSGAGKTTLAELFEQRFPGQATRKIIHFPYDNYAIPGFSMHGIEANEHPDSYDMNRMRNDFRALLRGEEIEIPPPYYDQNRPKKYLRLGEDDILLVDGLHVLHPKFLQGLPEEAEQIRVFLKAPKQMRFMRRLLRDIHRLKPFAILQMWRNVIEAEEEFVYPTEQNAAIVFDFGTAEETLDLGRKTQTVREKLSSQLMELSDSDDSESALMRIFEDVDHYLAQVAEPSDDSALVATPTGGIALKPDTMDFRVEGEGIKLNFPAFDLSCLEGGQDHGCAPKTLTQLKELKANFAGFRAIRIIKMSEFPMDDFLNADQEKPKSAQLSRLPSVHEKSIRKIP